MNSPGFTAEVSLSESNEQYELIANKVHFSKSRGYRTRKDRFRWMFVRVRLVSPLPPKLIGCYAQTV